MTDARLRELERRARKTRQPDDEAELLRERVRLGQLSMARVRVAAQMGSEGARLATGAPVTARSAEERLEFVTTLDDRHRVIALLGIGQECLELLRKRGADVARAELALAMIFAWLREPSDDLAEQAQSAAAPVIEQWRTCALPEGRITDVETALLGIGEGAQSIQRPGRTARALGSARFALKDDPALVEAIVQALLDPRIPG